MSLSSLFPAEKKLSHPENYKALFKYFSPVFFSAVIHWAQFDENIQRNRIQLLESFAQFIHTLSTDKLNRSKLYDIQVIGENIHSNGIIDEKILLFNLYDEHTQDQLTAQQCELIEKVSSHCMINQIYDFFHIFIICSLSMKTTCKSVRMDQRTYLNILEAYQKILLSPASAGLLRVKYSEIRESSCSSAGSYGSSDSTSMVSSSSSSSSKAENDHGQYFLLHPLSIPGKRFFDLIQSLRIVRINIKSSYKQKRPMNAQEHQQRKLKSLEKSKKPNKMEEKEKKVSSIKIFPPTAKSSNPYRIHRRKKLAASSISESSSSSSSRESEDSDSDWQDEEEEHDDEDEDDDDGDLEYIVPKKNPCNDHKEDGLVKIEPLLKDTSNDNGTQRMVKEEQDHSYSAIEMIQNYYPSSDSDGDEEDQLYWV